MSGDGMVQYDRKGRIIDPTSPDRCEHVYGDEDEAFIYTRTGVRLCWECVSEFASWMLDCGCQEAPDSWAWALASDDSVSGGAR